MKRAATTAGFLAALVCALPALSFPIQRVPHATTVEAVLNAFTPGDQSRPSVAARGVAGFVTVWQDTGDLPGGVKMRFLSAAGAPQGDEVWIDKSGPGPVRPRVASAANGSFAVAWATSQAAWVQRFDYLGRPQGGKLQLGPPLPLDPNLSLDVAMAPSGAFAVIFSLFDVVGSALVAQRFDASGQPLGAATGIDAGTPRVLRRYARVAAGPDGSLLAAWQEGASFFMMANRFDATTNSWSGVFQVNGNFFNGASPPAPLLYPGGRGLVVWNSSSSNGVTLVAQPLDAQGHLDGGLLTVAGGNVPTAEPAAAVDPAGNTFIVWSDDTSKSLMGIVLGWDFKPFAFGTAQFIADRGRFSAGEPAVAIDGGGRAEVVRTSNALPPTVPAFPLPPSNGEDGSSLGIVGEVYSTAFCDSGAHSQLLCLGPANRFMAGLTWKNPATGETGPGLVFSLTGDTGAFWFFGDQNLELMVKVVDGTSLNGNFWIYAGSLSNVEYTLTVEDARTGLTRTYHNPAGQFSSVADVQAFPSAVPASEIAAKTYGEAALAATSATGCPSDSAALCLGGGQFTVSVDFVDPRSGLAGHGTAVPLTVDTGAFWFFGDKNLELMIKVLDGRAINGKFWIFYGALSDVEYTVTVTRVDTGEVRTYHNPRGTLASHADTQAF